MANCFGNRRNGFGWSVCVVSCYDKSSFLYQEEEKAYPSTGFPLKKVYPTLYLILFLSLLLSLICTILCWTLSLYGIIFINLFFLSMTWLPFFIIGRYLYLMKAKRHGNHYSFEKLKLEKKLRTKRCKGGKYKTNANIVQFILLFRGMETYMKRRIQMVFIEKKKTFCFR